MSQGQSDMKGFMWGHRSVPWCSGHHCHFSQSPKTMCSDLRLPYPDCRNVLLVRGRCTVYVECVPACRCLFHLPHHPGFPAIVFSPCLSPILSLFFFFKPGTDAFDVPSLLSLRGSCSTSPVPFITALTNSSRA